jgi:DNA/RNA-binding domain of Phe-tRNA-synthetase-like protein
MALNFSKSASYMSRYGDVPFGLTLISSCQNFTSPPGFDQHRRKLLRKMRKRETLEQISKRIETYDQFFKSFGFECPLPKHLKRTINSGFPKYNLMVDAHFISEMCAGILVAVTDFDMFDGALTLDLADDGECCMGMGGRHIKTVQGEIVLRDERDIVCVLCQGADQKTRVKESTSNVLFYAYGVPGIDGRYIKDGLSLAADIMAQYGSGKIESIEIF